MKRCTVCTIEKSLNDYAKDSYRKDGYDATCKQCKKEQRKVRAERRQNVVISAVKLCSCCGEYVAGTHFDKKPGSIDGLHTECKDCKKEKRKLKKEENTTKELSEKYTKICSKCQIEKPKEGFYNQVYSTDGIGTICIECDKSRSKEWRQNNPDKVVGYRRKEYFKNYQNRRLNNTQFRLSGNIRNRVRMALKRQNSSKFNNTFELLGCSPSFMIKWLEWQFDSKMTWQNYGKYWCIDHVIPCAFFDLTQRQEQLDCFNWRNCRPCEELKNNIKNDKIIPSIILLQEIKVHYYERHIQIAGIS